MTDKTVQLGGLPYRVSDPEQEESALKAGATPITEQQALEAQAAQNDLSAVDKNWGTGGKIAMGGLSGLTLGLGPGLLASHGLVNPHHIQAMQASPWYTAGDIGGTVLPALLSGGDSLLGRGAMATPAGLAGLAGGGAESLAGALLGDSAGYLGKLGSSAIQQAARGATEGALYGLGHQVGDNLIQNKPLAAEALSATLGGGLFGGLVGGGIGTAGAAMAHGIDSLGEIGGRAAGAGKNRALGVVARTLGMGEDAMVAAERSGADIPQAGWESDGVGGYQRTTEQRVRLSDISHQEPWSQEKLASLEAKPSDAPIELMRDGTTGKWTINDGIHRTEMARRRGQEFISAKTTEYSPTVPSVGKTNGLKDTIERYGKEIQAGGSDIGESTSEKLAASRARQGVHGTLRDEAVQAMQDSAPELIPSVARIVKGIDADVLLPRVNTFGESKATSVVEAFKKDLPEHSTWSNLVKSRDQLAESIPSGHVSNPVLADTATVHREILNVLDREIQSGMEAAGQAHPDLMGMDKQYAAATQGLKTTQELENHLGKKLASRLLNNKSSIGPSNIGTFAGMAAIGHPVSGAAFLASKALGGAMEERVQPWLAQMAYNQAIGTKAAEATVAVKSHIGDSLRKFFSNAAKTPAKAANVVRAEKTKGDEGSRAAYESMANQTEQLLSNNHHDRVQRYAQELQSQGYDQLANEVMGVNQRAVLYSQQNFPPRQGSKSLTSLRKLPASKVPTFQEYKFMRIMDGVKKGPLSILDGLDNGSISRDAVKAVKYVYPEIHAEIVSQATEQIAEMKQSGQFMPLDKISSLGVALDAPIDSTLEPQFVNAVQAGLNAPAPAPEGQGKQSPAPPTDTFGTPISKDNPMLTTLQQVAVG